MEAWLAYVHVNVLENFSYEVERFGFSFEASGFACDHSLCSSSPL
jgi:hypothetical protein